MKYSQFIIKETLILALALGVTFIGLCMAQEPIGRKLLRALPLVNGGDEIHNVVDLSTGQGGGLVDPLWRVDGRPAYVTAPVGAWITSLSPAKWLQPVPSPTPSADIPDATFNYAVQFGYDAFYKLEGRLAADNGAKVFFDGNQIAVCPGLRCFEKVTPFSLPYVKAGVHTLKIEVRNTTIFSGLVVDAKLIQRQRPWDFDRDGRTDVSVFRPSNGYWYALLPTGLSATPLGTSGDQPVPGDYDGNGITDPAVFRSSTGTWYTSPNPQINYGAVQFGANGDIPVPGDYDNDVKTDIGVFRPSTGAFYLLHSSDNSFHFQQWGQGGDLPVVGDYDADGKTDLTVFRPSSRSFYILRSSDGTIREQQWGLDGDRPIAADFDGDGKTDICVYRPSDATWSYLQSSDNSLRSIAWGIDGDVPVAGDYDGDYKWDVAVFRPSSGVFYILQSASNALRAEQFGTNGDVPVAAAP